MGTKTNTTSWKYVRRVALAVSTAMAIAAGIFGGGSPAWSAVVKAPPSCSTKINELGGYQRLHAWCPGNSVKVGVSCSKGIYHQSSSTRNGYNKAECHRRTEGYITRGQVLIYQ